MSSQYPQCQYLNIFKRDGRYFWCERRRNFVSPHKSVITPYGHFNVFWCAPDCKARTGKIPVKEGGAK